MLHLHLEMGAQAGVVVYDHGNTGSPGRPVGISSGFKKEDKERGIIA